MVGPRIVPAKWTVLSTCLGLLLSCAQVWLDESNANDGNAFKVSRHALWHRCPSHPNSSPFGLQNRVIPLALAALLEDNQLIERNRDKLEKKGGCHTAICADFLRSDGDLSKDLAQIA
jgi:hypothetical protein